MPIPVPSEVRCHSRTTRDFGGLYAALVLLSFHGALVIYINSSFLEKFFDARTVGVLYIVSSLVTILGFLRITDFIRAYSLKTLTVLLTVLEFCVLISLAFVVDPLWVALLFILHQGIIPLMFFPLDMQMEALSGDCEGETGSRRGIFLTIMSLTIALSALLSGYLIGDTTPQFALVYLTAALLLLPYITLVLRSYTKSPPVRIPTRNLIEGLGRIRYDRDIRGVFGAHFLLQLFFSWMVIYTPIYLSTIMGFNWEEIGRILFIGLMAYVLLEYVIGVVADTWLGEKEMMAVGFLIIAVATSWCLFLPPEKIWLWMVAMFMTRVGASLVEITTESYFFKHTNASDSALISFFRITRPLSYVVGPLLGSAALLVVPMHMLFVLLALLMIPGFFFAMRLKDTR